MILHPCFHCPMKAICERPDDLRAKMKGFGCLVASISCRCPKELFPLGSCVSMNLTTYDIQYSYLDGTPDNVAYEDDYAGTVIGYRGRKVRVWLDEPTDENKWGIAKFYPDRLTRLDKPKVYVCPECGKPAGQVERRSFDGKKFDCWKCDGFRLWEDSLKGDLPVIRPQPADAPLFEEARA
jgi:hypothetical protein